MLIILRKIQKEQKHIIDKSKQFFILLKLILIVLIIL